MKASLAVRMLLAGAIAAHGAGALAQGEELPPAARAEVETLLATLGTSECQFYRNGQWYGGHDAQAHLRMKYDYLAKSGSLHSAEDFIAGAATKSSLSGEAYRVRCPNAPAMESAAWLGERLRERRTTRQ